MLIVYRAIVRGYAVVAVGPHLSGTNDFCFHRPWPPEEGIEIAEVGSLITRCRHIEHVISLLQILQQLSLVVNCTHAPVPLKAAGSLRLLRLCQEPAAAGTFSVCEQEPECSSRAVRGWFPGNLWAGKGKSQPLLVPYGFLVA